MLRVGLMGDSSTDEYRGTDNRGGAFAATTFNWMEQLVKGNRINAGMWGQWDEPRRTGYETNWAHSATTIQRLLVQQQHIGLGLQVHNSLIDLVIVSIGNHNFAPFNTGPQGYYVPSSNRCPESAAVRAAGLHDFDTA